MPSTCSCCPPSSYITVSPKDEQEKLAANVEKLLTDEKTEKTWINKEEGTFEYVRVRTIPAQTLAELFRSRRTAALPDR